MFGFGYLPFNLTLTQSHTHTHSLSHVLVVMMKSKELKTKIYSHAHSLILSLTIPVYVYTHTHTLILTLPLCVILVVMMRSKELKNSRFPPLKLILSVILSQCTRSVLMPSCCCSGAPRIAAEERGSKPQSDSNPSQEHSSDRANGRGPAATATEQSRSSGPRSRAGKGSCVFPAIRFSLMLAT